MQAIFMPRVQLCSNCVKAWNNWRHNAIRSNSNWVPTDPPKVKINKKLKSGKNTENIADGKLKVKKYSSLLKLLDRQEGNRAGSKKDAEGRKEFSLDISSMVSSK